MTTGSPPPLPSARAAATIYVALISSTLIVVVGAAVVGRSLARFSLALGVIDVAALVAGFGALAMVAVLRSRLRPRAELESVDAWWRANLGRVMPLWALLELPAALGAVVLFATGHALPLLGLALLSLGGFAVLSPGRLAG